MASLTATPFTEIQERDTVELVKCVMRKRVQIVMRSPSRYFARLNSMTTPSKDTEEQVKTSAITYIKYWGGTYL